MSNELTTSPIKATAELVAKYAKTLINDDRAKRFAASVALLAKDNPKIANASQDSLLTAMMACVHLDLMPNTPEGFAYIIPYGSGVQFQLGYKGLVELAYRSGQVKSISAELVFPEDEFEVIMGTERKLVHKPDITIDRTKFDNIKAVYAAATLSNGSHIFEVMNKSELDKIRISAKAKSTDAPWQTWPESMAKKTVVKRLMKLIPKSASDNRLDYAVAYDSWAEAGKLGVDEDGRLIEAKKIKPEQSDEDKKLAADTAADVLAQAQSGEENQDEDNS